MNWKLLEPISVGGKRLRNRIVMPPMETRMSTIDGDATQRMVDYYAQRAKGGAGLIIIENTYVDHLASRSSRASSGLCSDHLIAGKQLLAEAIRENGAAALIQLCHGGRQARVGVTAYEPVAPSAVMCSVTNRVPHVLTRKEIIAIEDAFAAAAWRAKEAGYDGVEVHGAHGYLINQFLSPRTNRRTDEYGGSLANRGRFARNIIHKIRETFGRDWIVGYRITAKEYVDGGLEPEEACEFVASIQDDIDYISVTAGIYESQAFCNVSSTYVPAGQLRPYARQMKQAVRIPVIAVGSFNPRLAEQSLLEGEADLIAFGRALVADPELPNKLASGREKSIRPCIRGNEGCLSGFYTGCAMRCEVNPACGREADYRWHSTSTPKKVLIVGGGASGMEAARIAASLGHRVTLMEKDDRLGGHLIESSNQTFKVDMAELLAWQIRELEASDAKILLNTAVTPEVIAREAPDAVILAIGSEYMRPGVPGADQAMIAREVLMDRSLVGEKVIVVGGGMIGAETALTLAQENRKVVLLEMLGKIARELEPSAWDAMMRRMQQKQVNLVTGHTVTEIGAKHVKAKDDKGETIVFDADNVVLATGLASRSTAELARVVGNTICIGDCVSARSVYHCMHEAWHAVRKTLCTQDAPH